MIQFFHFMASCEHDLPKYRGEDTRYEGNDYRVLNHIVESGGPSVHYCSAVAGDRGNWCSTHIASGYKISLAALA